MLLICKNILFLILFLLFYNLLISQRVLIIVFFKVSFLWLLIFFPVLSAFHLVGLSKKKKKNREPLTFHWFLRVRHKKDWPEVLCDWLDLCDCWSSTCRMSVLLEKYLWGVCVYISFPSPSGGPLRFSRERSSNPLLGGYKYKQLVFGGVGELGEGGSVSCHSGCSLSCNFSVFRGPSSCKPSAMPGVSELGGPLVQLLERTNIMSPTKVTERDNCQMFRAGSRRSN